MVHQYKSNGYNMVLDVCSGSVHVVDDMCYDIIEVYEKYIEAKREAFTAENSDEKIVSAVTKTECNCSDSDNDSSSGSCNDECSDGCSDSTVIQMTDEVIPDFTEGITEEYIIEKLLETKYKEADIPEIKEDIKLINELKESGQLFTEDIYEKAVIDFKKRKTVVKALCLHIAHDCNLACRYCFAEEGEYKGRRALMSYEVGKQALDFLIANSGSRVNLEVDFFGGEPTMNFDVVKKLVEYGRSREKEANKKFRFTLTTNGILLDDDIMEFANKEMANVVLSIDGRKEINDYMRPTRNGKGSYDIIVPKFKKFVEMRRNNPNPERRSYYVRGTFTRNNLDFASDVLALIDEGFDQISVEPVVASPEDDYSLREVDVPVICAEYDKLATALIKKHEEYKEGKTKHPINFFHFMIDLTGGPCVYKRLSGCGSGTEYLAVTPWGDLYPCHQFVGIDDFNLGNVFEGIKKTETVNEFKLCNVYAKPKCRNCFARFYCSGGCAANSYQFHGHINDAYDVGCDLERKRIECALMLKAALCD